MFSRDTRPILSLALLAVLFVAVGCKDAQRNDPTTAALPVDASPFVADVLNGKASRVRQTETTSPDDAVIDRPKFPQYEEAASTGGGYQEYVGVLLIDSGCLRLISDSPRFPENGFLLVWPPGFSVSTAADPVQIIDNSGLIAATVGESVQVRENWLLASPTALDCAGPHLAITDEIHSVMLDEPAQATSSADALPVAPMFPLHELPISTNDGRGVYLGKLVVEDGCLRLVGDRPVLPDDRFQRYPDNGYLLVWPPGYSINTDVEPIQIIDGAGLIVARVGDTIRVSKNDWYPRRSGPADPEPTPIPLPLGCAGPPLVIGDQVHAVVPDEPTEIKVPGSTLYFPRQKTLDRSLIIRTVQITGKFYLDGDCLRAGSGHGSKPGRLLVWPAGFTPHIEDGMVFIRNGGGRTIARVGDWVNMIDYSRESYFPRDEDFPRRCGGGGTYWVAYVYAAAEPE